MPKLITTPIKEEKTSKLTVAPIIKPTKTKLITTSLDTGEEIFKEPEQTQQAKTPLPPQGKMSIETQKEMAEIRRRYREEGPSPELDTINTEFEAKHGVSVIPPSVRNKAIREVLKESIVEAPKTGVELGAELATGFTGWKKPEELAHEKGYTGRVADKPAHFAGRAGRMAVEAAAAAGIGRATGALTESLTSSKVLQAAGTTIPRTAAFFGLDYMADETAKYANKEKELTKENIRKSLKGLGEETAGGGGIAVTHLIPVPEIRVPAAMMARWHLETAREKREELPPYGLEEGFKTNFKNVPAHYLKKVVKTGLSGLFSLFSGIKYPEPQEGIKQIEGGRVINVRPQDYKITTIGKEEVSPQNIKNSIDLVRNYLPDQFYQSPVKQKMAFLNTVLGKLDGDVSINEAIPQAMRETGLGLTRISQLEQVKNVSESIQKLKDLSMTPEPTGQEIINTKDMIGEGAIKGLAQDITATNKAANISRNGLDTVLQKTFYGYNVPDNIKSMITNQMHSDLPMGRKSAEIVSKLFNTQNELISPEAWEKFSSAYEQYYLTDKAKFLELTQDIPNAELKAENMKFLLNFTKEMDIEAGSFSSGWKEGLVAENNKEINALRDQVSALRNRLEISKKSLDIPSDPEIRKSATSSINALTASIDEKDQEIARLIDENKKVQSLLYVPRDVISKETGEVITDKAIGREILTREEGYGQLESKGLKYKEELPEVLAKRLAKTMYRHNLAKLSDALIETEYVQPEFSEAVAENPDDWAFSHKNMKVRFNNKRFYVDELKDKNYKISVDNEGEYIKFTTNDKYPLSVDNKGRPYFHANYKVHSYVKSTLNQMYALKDRNLLLLENPIRKMQGVFKDLVFWNAIRMPTIDMGETIAGNHSGLTHLKELREAFSDYATNTKQVEDFRLEGAYNNSKFTDEDMAKILYDSRVRKTLSDFLHTEITIEDVKNALPDLYKAQKTLTFNAHHGMITYMAKHYVNQGYSNKVAVDKALDLLGGGGLLTKEAERNLSLLFISPDFTARLIKFMGETSKGLYEGIRDQDPNFNNSEILRAAGIKHAIIEAFPFIVTALGAGSTYMATHRGEFITKEQVGPLKINQYHVRKPFVGTFMPENFLGKELHVNARNKLQYFPKLVFDWGLDLINGNDIKDFRGQIRVHANAELPQKAAEFAKFAVMSYLAPVENVMYEINHEHYKSTTAKFASIMLAYPDYFRGPDKKEIFVDRLWHRLMTGKPTDAEIIEKEYRATILAGQLFDEKTMEIIKASKTEEEALTRLVQAGKITTSLKNNVKNLNRIKNPSYLYYEFQRLPADKKWETFNLLKPNTREKLLFELPLDEMTIQRAIEKEAFRNIPFEDLMQNKTTPKPTAPKKRGLIITPLNQ